MNLDSFRCASRFVFGGRRQRGLVRAGVLLPALLLGGCWENRDCSIRLGDVSLGQQLMDLQRARASGALEEAEYQRLRGRFIELMLDGSAPGVDSATNRK